MTHKSTRLRFALVAPSGRPAYIAHEKDLCVLGWAKWIKHVLPEDATLEGKRARIINAMRADGYDVYHADILVELRGKCDL